MHTAEPENQNQPEFDEFADNYRAILDEGLSATGENADFFANERLRWMLQVLPTSLHRGARILDFGCGIGNATPFFQTHFQPASFIGCDPSEASLDIANKRFKTAGVEFMTPEAVGEITPADFAYCNGVFHHIPIAARAEAVQTVFAALKPGGIFAYWENNPWNPMVKLLMKRVAFDRDAITLTPPESRQLLRNAGFQVSRTDFRFFFPRSLAALRGLERWLLKVPLGGQYLILGVKP